MASPWVTTKVTPPRLRRGVVDRPRLVSRLAGSPDAKLTLVSAPAGFGKTTAVTAWLASSVEAGRSVAWVSLDAGDSQPESFWTYVALALQTVTPAIGASVLQGLEAGQPASQGTVTTLLNDIADQDLDIDLVLDDYHLADSEDVATGMTFLLDHLPHNLRVVIATRADPDLPLSRLRARGELVDVRARDLRFTDDEAASYLRNAGAPQLAEAEVATLTQRTEGWAAALQLAALSMHGRDDVGAFVSGFAGTDRYVVDYLVDEVLARQPDGVRTFLLRTSVLDRLAGDLCDAVTEGRDGRAMLEFLYRENLFLVPLDDQRQWYRYHHLFADVLQTHLLDTSPDEVSILHRRASAWYSGAGDPASAVRHALLAGDVQGAADVAERAAPLLERDRREATVRSWVDEFPDDVVRRRPVLAIAFVGALMRANDFAVVDRRLREVESWLPAIHARLSHTTPSPRADSPDPDTMVVIDEDELARVPAAVHLYRAALALVEGDLAATVERAQLAHDEAPLHDETIRGAASALSGLASWASGDLESAHDAYEVCIGHLLRAGHLSDVLGCTIALSDIRITQGRLTDARKGYEDALRIAEQDPSGMRGVADMHVGLAEVSLERGEIEAAREHLASAHELGEALGLPQFPYRWRAASAVLAEAEGERLTALELLSDAERVYVGDFSPDVRPLHARKARIQASLADFDAVSRWATDHGVTPDGPFVYAREFEHVTLAEVLLAQHAQDSGDDRLQAALALLERVGEATQAGGRLGTHIDALALQALGADAAGDAAGCDAALERAVTLAEPEGQVRAFARHGRAMAVLLDRAMGRRPRSAHWARLRQACDDEAADRAPSATSTALVDPLSARESEILRLLATDLDGPEIARHLVVSVNTVRTHTKNIYAKLGVSSRRAAVSRARELGLLPGR